MARRRACRWRERPADVGRRAQDTGARPTVETRRPRAQPPWAIRPSCTNLVLPCDRHHMKALPTDSGDEGARDDLRRRCACRRRDRDRLPCLRKSAPVAERPKRRCSPPWRSSGSAPATPPPRWRPARTPPTASSSRTCPARTTPRCCSGTRRPRRGSGRSVLVLATHGRRPPPVVRDLARARRRARPARPHRRRPRHRGAHRVGLPVVLVARPRWAPVDSVRAERARAARDLGEHLVGHTGPPGRVPRVPAGVAGRRRAVAGPQGLGLHGIEPTLTPCLFDEASGARSRLGCSRAGAPRGPGLRQRRDRARRDPRGGGGRPAGRRRRRHHRLGRRHGRPPRPPRPSPPSANRCARSGHSPPRCWTSASQDTARTTARGARHRPGGPRRAAAHPGHHPTRGCPGSRRKPS